MTKLGIRTRNTGLGILKQAVKNLSQISGQIQRYLPSLFLTIALLAIPTGSALVTSTSSESAPSFTIVGVTRDDSVTIRTNNFPASQEFSATMGPMGTRGINGTEVGKVNSGSGGSFEATFPVPNNLVGSSQVSIRLQTDGTFPYFAYNWFYNSTVGMDGSGSESGDNPSGAQAETTPGYTGVPTFQIVDVLRDDSVTVETNNYPSGQVFNVTMGPFGTQGIDGITVGTFEAGLDNDLSATYDIPTELFGQSRIAIRMQTSGANPYFAYNWFYNNTTNGSASSKGGAQPEKTSETKSPVVSTTYTGIPVMVITAVKRDASVTFETGNYPPNEVFDVYMGPTGTQATNGIWVGQFQSGSGGSFPVMVPIPEELKGSNQIAIRAETSQVDPYFSYNWFYNNTTS